MWLPDQPISRFPFQCSHARISFSSMDHFLQYSLSAPNAQAELRGLMFSRRAAVSSSLWLAGNYSMYYFELYPFSLYGLSFSSHIDSRIFNSSV